MVLAWNHQKKIRRIPRKLYLMVKDVPARGVASVDLKANPVGEPDAGNPHVRFDERGPETGQQFATAPVFDSTQRSTATAYMLASTALRSIGFLDGGPILQEPKAIGMTLRWSVR